jgi:uncharacterized protein YndB with AHSA1/START domain
MTAKPTHETSDREFVVSRLIDAPRERVWEAWTDPARLAAWFGPKRFETVHAKLDFRPGGTEFVPLDVRQGLRQVLAGRLTGFAFACTLYMYKRQ